MTRATLNWTAVHELIGELEQWASGAQNSPTPTSPDTSAQEVRAIVQRYQGILDGCDPAYWTPRHWAALCVLRPGSATVREVQSAVGDLQERDSQVLLGDLAARDLVACVAQRWALTEGGRDALWLEGVGEPDSASPTDYKANVEPPAAPTRVAIDAPLSADSLTPRHLRALVRADRISLYDAVIAIGLRNPSTGDTRQACRRRIASAWNELLGGGRILLDSSGAPTRRAPGSQRMRRVASWSSSAATARTSPAVQQAPGIAYARQSSPGVGPPGSAGSSLTNQPRTRTRG